MATYSWSIPSGNTITGSTIIKDTDNKIQNTIDDLVDFVNSEGNHSESGLTYDLVTTNTTQVISGAKTFSGGLIGSLPGDISGNATTATKLATPRNISLTGDVTGSASFDGSSSVSISATITNESHTHSTSEISGLDTALTAVNDSLLTKITASDYATATTGGTIKLRVSGGVLYITTTGSNA